MKKILRLLKRRNNGGFTLVEVIISCALLAILILAVMGMITPVMSAVTLNEKNANALMITEAVEAYIDRNIKNSVYCAVFTNAGANNSALGAMSTDLFQSTGLIRQSDALKEMLNFMSTDNNKDIYEMKIIGIRWLQDAKTHHYKYMVTKITPQIKDDGSDFKYFMGTYEKRIFEDCFYDNLYPEVSFEVMAYNEHEDGDETKPIVSTRNVALKTTIDVYSNPDRTALAARGEGKADFINIRTKAINPDGDYKLYSIEGGDDAMGNPITVTTQLRTDAELQSAYGVTAHPETYIIYITRKLKYFEPATP